MRSFPYVGPASVREAVRSAPRGTCVDRPTALEGWLQSADSELASEDGWATYVIDLEGRLVLAPRRSEHVACAGGDPVLAAGEIQFDESGAVLEVTNNSTGYCPSEDCWPAVCSALESVALETPDGFTFVARFRTCPQCDQRNLVKDGWFHCLVCDSPLPREWNVRGPTIDR